MNLKTPISHFARFSDIENIIAANGLRLGPDSGAYPRRALKLQWGRLRFSSPRLTVKGFHKLTQANPST